MIGVGFTEQHSKMIQQLLAGFGETLGTDVPKFDFSVSLSENRSSRLGYKKVYRDPDPRFLRMIDNQTIVATSPTFYISSGFLLLSVYWLCRLWYFSNLHGQHADPICQVCPSADALPV